VTKHPKGWKIERLDKLADVQTGIAKGAQKERPAVSLPYLRVANVQDGHVDLTEMKVIDVPERKVNRFLLRRGDLLMTEGGDFDKLGRGCIWEGQIDPCVHQNHVFAVRVTSPELHNEFLEQLTASPWGRRYFLSCSKQSTNLASVNTSQLKAFPVLLPPVSEQKKIATIIGAWDTTMEKLQSLLTAKMERLRTLRQQLLTGTRRFPAFKKERWSNLKLGDVVTYQPRLTTKPKGAFLAAGIRSHGKGVFLKHDFEAKDIALEELWELRTDDLVVNITFGWEGAVAIVPPEANGALVSHRFPTFIFKPGVSFPGYFRHVIRQQTFIFEMGLASPGGAGRNRVLSKKNFLRIPIKLPPLEEQKRIAAVLNACAQEIHLLEAELEALKLQKRGLMQKLLTGEKRVKP